VTSLYDEAGNVIETQNRKDDFKVVSAAARQKAATR
jgi:hypothetical protein